MALALRIDWDIRFLRTSRRAHSFLEYIFLNIMMIQVFLTMGFQRETAGKGTMAVYTQVLHILQNTPSIF